METKIFRFECGAAGLEEAVQNLSTKSDSVWKNKPDESWRPNPGKFHRGSIHFWKPQGLEKYEDSGLRDWQLSVVSEESKLIIAELTGTPIYEDDFQIVCAPDSAKILRTYYLKYHGPRPFLPPVPDERSNYIRHFNSTRDWCAYAAYPPNKEVFSVGSYIGQKLGLSRIAVNHEIIKPNSRTSWPHAHKIEEEAIFILKGFPEVWVNGESYPAKPGDFVYFPFASGLAHTLINNSDEDIEVLVLGEQDKEIDWIYYPLHPERNQECKDLGYYWDDYPKLPMGDHDGAPGRVSSSSNKKYKYQIHIDDLEATNCQDGEKTTYFDRDLGRKIGMKRIAFHHQVLPAGFRSSIPHAESEEEEFVFVLKGEATAWINGHRWKLTEGDCVGFPSGTGILHTIINDSKNNTELLVIGEMTKPENRCAFPLNPEKESSCSISWSSPPVQKLGTESPMP